jgi:exodeoxyribonuclease V gamma subunit
VSRLLGAFVVEDSRTAGEHSAVRHALLALGQHASAAGFDEAIDLASFRALLGQVLDARPSAQGFLAGGVTFCQLMPMRSIPFRVVCLLGLHDGAFPASDVPMDFDLLAKQRKPGDRRRRDDDRQLFLEALLSARRNFLITYIGQSIHDGKPLLPSVLVTELIDHLSRGFTVETTAPETSRSSVGSLEAALVTRHALLAVSPRYFRTDDDPRLFSYAGWALAGARAVSEPKRPTRPFFAQPEQGAQPEQPLPAVGLAELEECLVRPQRMFAQRQLGLMLGRDLESAADREPFELDALERWQVASDLLVRALDAPAVGGSLELARARGVLPLGTPGALAFRELDRQVDAIVKAVDPYARAGRLSPLEIDLQLGPTRLSGSLDQVWPSAQLRVQYSKGGNRHELRHFVRHLALLCVRAQRPAHDLPERSLLVGRDKDGNVMQVEFGPLRDPAGALMQLLDVFALAQAGPLPLFENASRAYAAALHEGKSESQALDSARSRFGSGFEGSFGDDSSDAYVAQFFPSFDAALEAHGAYAFTTLAVQVYGPLYSSRRQL